MGFYFTEDLNPVPMESFTTSEHVSVHTNTINFSLHASVVVNAERVRTAMILTAKLTLCMSKWGRRKLVMQRCNSNSQVLCAVLELGIRADQVKSTWHSVVLNFGGGD